MSDGGFSVIFDGKKVARCYEVSFDYDNWEYTINGQTKKKLPLKVRKIVVDIEEPMNR